MASSFGLHSSLTATWFIIVAVGTVAFAEEIRVAELIASKAPAEPLPLALPRRSPQNMAPENTERMQNDKKKSLADNEVFDVSTKGQLDFVLAELREMRSEIREARQEHSRLASGISEISGQVRTIGERKDQIKKKIRKLTKTLSKKDHHRKVKSGLRALQQDHERILQAMSKAKLMGRFSARRNRTNHGHMNATHHGKKPKAETNEVGFSEEVNVTDEEPIKPEKEAKGKMRGKGNRPSNANEVEDKSRDVKPVVLPVEFERKLKPTSGTNEIKTPEVSNMVGQQFTPMPTKEPPTTTTTTTTTPSTTTTSTTSTAATTLPPVKIPAPAKATSEPLPLNCYEVLQHGNWTSGVYTIQPSDMEPIQVWCDQRTDGGGWTIIVARKPEDEQEDFARPWADYKRGFGDPTKEHWIGLEAMHQMTKNKKHELRVNISDWHDEDFHAQWKEFSVDGEDRSYMLNIGRYMSSSSTAGDALKWHNSMKFSTIDRDNDALMGGHCARNNQGGWWYRGYRGCYQAHPTGVFQRIDPFEPTTTAATQQMSGKNNRSPELGPYIYWVNWRGNDLFPKTMFLMIRPSLN